MQEQADSRSDSLAFPRHWIWSFTLLSQM